jgi:hypothetical protein
MAVFFIKNDACRCIYDDGRLRVQNRRSRRGVDLRRAYVSED